MKFTLEIELGNDAMQYWAQVENAVRRSVSFHGGLVEIGEYETIYDRNGNTVGKWEVIP